VEWTSLLWPEGQAGSVGHLEDCFNIFMTTSFVAGGHNYLAKSSRSIIEKKAYFWDEIRLRTASQLTGGCLYPIKVVLEFSEKIGRIQNAEPKLEGRGNYEFMLVPGVASSVEEWQREIDARHETAALRDAIAAIRGNGGSRSVDC
jgi:hypothetical protein